MMEYLKPSVEIISFLAKQALATEADDTNNNEFPLDKTDELSFVESVEPW